MPPALDLLMLATPMCSYAFVRIVIPVPVYLYYYTCTNEQCLQLETVSNVCRFSGQSAAEMNKYKYLWQSPLDNVELVTSKNCKYEQICVTL